MPGCPSDLCPQPWEVALEGHRVSVPGPLAHNFLQPRPGPGWHMAGPIWPLGDRQDVQKHRVSIWSDCPPCGRRPVRRDWGGALPLPGSPSCHSALSSGLRPRCFVPRETPGWGTQSLRTTPRPDCLENRLHPPLLPVFPVQKEVE